MLRKVIYSIGIIFLLSSYPSWADSQVEVNDNLTASFDEETDKLTITNYHLTYYLFRGIGDNGSNGNLRLIKPTSQWLDFDVIDVEAWDGFFPASMKDINFKWPERKSEDTPLLLSGSDFGNNQEWRTSSDFTLRGIGLAGFLTNESEYEGEFVDNITLSLLNILKLTEISLSTYESATAAGLTKEGGSYTKKIFDSLRPLAEKIADYKTTLKKAGVWLDIAEVLTNQIDLFIEEAEKANLVNLDDDSVLNQIVYNTKSVNNNIVVAINQLSELTGGAISVASLRDSDRVDKLKKALTDQYKDIEEMNIDAGEKLTDSIMESAAKNFASLYTEKLTSNTDSDDDLIILVDEFIIEPMGEMIKIYLGILEDELAEAEEDYGKSQAATTKEVIDDLEDRIDFLKKGRTLILASQVFMALKHTGVIELAKERPQEFINMLRNIGTDALSSLTSEEIVETLAKKTAKSYNLITNNVHDLTDVGVLSSKVKAERAGFTLGNEIANKMLPFLWDFTTGIYDARASISNNQLNQLGYTKATIRAGQVDSSIKNEQILGDNNTITLYKGEAVTIGLLLERELLFDNKRSPWLTNYHFNPQSLYSTRIHVPNEGFKETYLCAKKTFGDLDYMYRSRGRLGEGITYLTKNCFEGQTFSVLDWGKGTAEYTDDVYNNPDTLPELLKLKSTQDNNLGGSVVNNLTLIPKGNEIKITVDGIADFAKEYSININYKLREPKISLKSTSSSGFEVVWQPISNAVSYVVCLSEGSSITDKSSCTLGDVTSTAYIFTASDHNLSAGQQYYIRAYAIDNEGMVSELSNEITTSLDQKITLLVDKVGNATTTVSWNTLVGDSVVYGICIQENYVGEHPELLCHENLSAPSFVFENLLNGVEYSVTVTSTDSATNRIIANTSLLVTPSNFSVTERNSNNTVTFSWDAIEGIDSYIIYLASSSVSEASYDEKYELAPSFTTLNVELDPRKDFYAILVPIKNGVGKNTMPEVFIEATEAKVLAAPASFKASSTSEEITLTWDLVEGALGYSVCQAEEPITSIEDCQLLKGGQWWEPILTTSVDITSELSEFNTKGAPLKDSKYYYFRVVSQDESLQSLPSEEVSVKISPALTTQKENEFAILEGGITDLPENVSYYLRDGEAIYFGTENGKIISLNSNNLTKKADTVLLSTDSFKHVDAKVDYLYKKDDVLYIAIAVRPPRDKEKNSADAYILKYKTEDGKLVQFLEYFQVKSDIKNGGADGPPVTGMYATATHLYLTMNGNIAIYDTSSTPEKELAFYWVYGGDVGLCGIGDNVYVRSRLGHVTKYRINEGVLEGKSDSSGIRNGLMICKDDFIITENYIFDSNLSVLFTFDEPIDDPNQMTISNNTAYIYKYYPKDYASCNIRRTIVDLEDFTSLTSESEIMDAEAIASYTSSCPHNYVWGGVYKTINGYSNILSSGEYPRSRAINVTDSLEIDSIYAFAGNYIEASANDESVYTLFDNKIMHIDAVNNKKNDIFTVNNGDDNLSSLIVDGKDMFHSYNWRASSIDSLFKSSISEDGLSATLEESVNGGFYVNISQICSGKIFGSGIRNTLSGGYSVYSVIDKETLIADSTQRYGINYNSTFCYKNNTYDYYRSSGSYSSISKLLFDDVSGGWKVGDISVASDVSLGEYFWLSNSSLVFRNSVDDTYTKVNPGSGTVSEAKNGIDMPFRIKKSEDDESYDYTFYDEFGVVEKQVENACVPVLDTSKFPILRNDTLYFSAYSDPTSSSSSLCIIH